jgi:hypothetical protein
LFNVNNQEDECQYHSGFLVFKNNDLIWNCCGASKNEELAKFEQIIAQKLKEYEKKLNIDEKAFFIVDG